jgi:hypothetical protein
VDAPASITMNATSTVVAAARADSCVTRCAALRSPGTAFCICIYITCQSRNKCAPTMGQLRAKSATFELKNC